MLAQDDVMPLVERLGGWAVVVWIVLWLTRRWEVRMDTLSQAMATQTAAMSQLLSSLAEHHSFMTRSMAQVNESVTSTGRMLAILAEKLRISAP